MPNAQTLVLMAIADRSAASRFRAAFEAHGFDVVLAPDGFTAADVTLRRRPALVIVDMVLPELDAGGVCRLLKARPATHETPVLVLVPAAGSTPDDRRALIDSGADQVIVAPCGPELLVLEALRLARPVVPRPDAGRWLRRIGDVQVGQRS